MEKVPPDSWNSEAAVVDFGSCFPQINWEPLAANDTAYGTTAPHPLYFSPIQLRFMPADVVGLHNLNPINNVLESINLQHVLPRSVISFATSDKWCWWEFWLYIFAKETFHFLPCLLIPIRFTVPGGVHWKSGGACMVAWGGVHGCSRGACKHAWLLQGGMHGCTGGGHAWFFSMRYGQWAGGTHPTGMHSCFWKLFTFSLVYLFISLLWYKYQTLQQYFIALWTQGAGGLMPLKHYFTRYRINFGMNIAGSELRKGFTLSDSFQPVLVFNISVYAIDDDILPCIGGNIKCEFSDVTSL